MHRLSLAVGVCLAVAGCAAEKKTEPPQRTPSAARSTVAVDLTTAPADGTTVVRATATVLDDAGGAITGVTVAFAATGSGNTWTPATAVTGAGGTAVADLSTTTAGLRTVSATAAGVAIAQTRDVTFTAAPSPALSSLDVSAPSAAADGAAAVTATATVRDHSGAPMAGVTVVFAASGSAATWAPAASAVTAADGTAAASLSATASGARTVSATAGGVPLAQTRSVTFTAVPSAALSSLAVSAATAVADGVASVTATATVRDHAGVAMPGVTVIFAATGADATWTPSSAVTGADGTAAAALATTVAGPRTISATAGGTAIAQTQAVTFTVVPSASLSSLGVSATTADADGAATITATATVRDPAGAPIEGITVAFSATGAGATWTPAGAVTAADGTASAALATTAAGPRTISASAGGIAITQTQAVTFTAVPSPALSSLSVSATSVAADGVAAVTATATVRDHAGAAMAGVTVVFSATGGAVTFTPPSAVTGGSGVASSAATATAPGARTLAAAAGGVAIAETRQVTFVASDLRITELGNFWYYDVPAWLEIHNGTTAAVNLSAYTLRTGGIDPTDGVPDVESATFTLPAYTLQPGAFAVVAGVGPWSGADGGGLLHAGSVTQAPFWFESGFVELVRAGATVDFVRFGSSAVAPTTPGAWSGANAPAFPLGADQYAVTLARRPIGTDTDAAADWVQVSFPTPGGPNDVAPGATASDGDGIPDSAKVAGGTFAGLDLHGMGARPGQRDVFLELDAMASADPGIVPRREAVDMVVARFAGHGIVLHFDAGSRFAPSFDPANHNLGQTTATVPYAICVNFPQASNGDGCVGNLYTYRAQQMALARRAIFHYVLFGSSQRADGAGWSSGRADLPGPHLLVTLGNWGLAASPQAELNRLVNYQAGTLMHELGHNLRLRHGGHEDQNYKPNYLSVMNYLYQLNGLPDPAAASAGDRYFLEYPNAPVRHGTREGLDAGPLGSPAAFRLDFSDGSGATLNESAVSDPGGLGRGGAAVDFNFNGNAAQAPYALDLNPHQGGGGAGLGTLADHDDWTNLSLPFHSAFGWAMGGAPKPASEPLAPALPAVHFGDRAREVSQEAPPPASFFEELRRAAGRR